VIAAHDVRIGAPRFLGGGKKPIVVRRLDQNFIQGLFRDLRTDEGRDAIRSQIIPDGSGGDAQLYQPVHRVHNLVLVELFCDTPGQPRLAPEKVQSAVAVIRRRLPVGGSTQAPSYGSPQRWGTEVHAVRGWLPIHDELEDPESKYRPQVSAGHPHVDARLIELRERSKPPLPIDESVTRLYRVPRDVCEALGATLMFAVINATDNELVDPPPHIPSTRASQATRDPLPAHDDSTVRAMLPAWLRQLTPAASVPFSGSFRSRDIGSDDVPVLVVERNDGSGWSPFIVPDPTRTAPDGNLQSKEHFVRMFWQLAVELDAFSDRPSSRRLKAALAGVPIPVGGSTTTAAALLEQASRVFVFRDEGAAVTLPSTWPTLGRQVEDAMIAATKDALAAQLARHLATEGRYERHDARYQIRAFARVWCDDGCPPHLYPSDPTPNLRIVRWYEGGPEGAITPQIEVPGLDRNFFKNLRPNVTMKVPRTMFNFIQNNDPKDFLAGDAKNDVSGPDFAWICGFNISIIFIIAFMLLMIFVILLNLIFWWMPFFKICIPLPRGMFEPQDGH
jgi:hypothetical protein